MKSNTDIRTAALNWWKNQSEAFKALQFTQYKKENFTPANFHTELTGREIEAIFTDLGLSERAIKESTHITWWKGLNEEEQTKLCQKHFQGIPVDSLMDKSILAMYHFEHPQNTDTGTGEIIKAHNSNMLLAMEFGYRECEKGNNLDMAFINFNKALNNK